MMFLQYMLFAVWWVPLAAYLVNLNMTGLQKSLILSSMAIGSMASPFIGMLADKKYASQNVLAALNFITTLFLLLAANITHPVFLLAVIIITMLSYMPTWSLTSAIAMAHTSAEQFPRIRVFGSIGWVVSGIFSVIAIRQFGVEIFDGSKLPFYCGAGISLCAALTNLFLPHTPPTAKNQNITLANKLGFGAFRMFRDKNFRVFMILSFFSILPFSLYHVFGSEFLQSQEFRYITFTMNLGQVVEPITIGLI